VLLGENADITGTKVILRYLFKKKNTKTTGEQFGRGPFK
jgi:hypothetical protein